MSYNECIGTDCKEWTENQLCESCKKKNDARCQEIAQRNFRKDALTKKNGRTWH